MELAVTNFPLPGFRAFGLTDLRFQRVFGFNGIRSHGFQRQIFILVLSEAMVFTASLAKRVGAAGRSERCSNTRAKCRNMKSVAPQTERPSRATLRRKWCEAPFFAYFGAAKKVSAAPHRGQ
jgi:hypothetical protein